MLLSGARSARRPPAALARPDPRAAAGGRHPDKNPDPNAKEIRYFCRTVGRVFLHPTSVNFSAGKFESPWLLWTERVETSKIFLRQSSMISPYAILLFGGQLQVEHEAGLISLDGTWSFKAPARIGILIRELRDEVRGLLAEKLENPAMQISSSPIVDALLTLLSSDGF